jgi:hypothetical protein
MTAQLDISHVGERGILMAAQPLLIHLRNDATNCETVTREFHESNDVIKFENLDDWVGTWNQYIITGEDHVWRERLPYMIQIDKHDAIVLSFQHYNHHYSVDFEMKRDRVDWKKEGF